MLRRLAQNWLVSLVFLSGLSLHVFAENPPEINASVQSQDPPKPRVAAEKKEVAPKKDFGFNAGEVIMEHISDSHEWHFFTYKRADGTEVHASICLPVIIYTPGAGLSIFSFKRLHHAPYKSFSLDTEGHIVRTDGRKFYDFSLTKNVIQLMISMVIMLLLFLTMTRNYKKYGTKAPRGLQSALEVIVVFIRDEIAKPMLGKRADKFLPYLLTLFFFIWINNMLGLIPGSANVTGNIAITATLALFTFILMMAGSKRTYWKHMIAPPGVPIAVLPILIPIEFISNIIVKPFALMIRLFANMLAGHLIILSFMAIIFIFSAMNLFAGAGATIFSVAFSIFIYMLELLVAALQAYIFTILTALFIGETGVEDSHSGEHH